MQKALKYFEIFSMVLLPTVLIGCAALGWENPALLSIMVVVISLVPFFLAFEISRPRPRDIVPVVVLVALATAGRILFAPVPNFKPVTAIVILGGLMFGKHNGFLIGAVTAVVSNFYFGQGPWTPWQMYAWGMIGYVFGVLRNCRCMNSRIFICIFGAVLAYLYGILLDTWFIIGYVQPITPETIIGAYLSSAVFDISHAISTAIFLAIIFLPWRRKLIRIKLKYGLMEI